jgi:hypothetical protein
MNRQQATAVLSGPLVALLAPASAAVAADYLTVAQAQHRALALGAGPQPPHGRLLAWRVQGEAGPLGFFLTDEVVGRQDFIDYALGINADGTLRSPEIMSYRESHGGEIRNAAWRRQFERRSDGARLRNAIDIRNIAGATLSCEHLTAGVRYLTLLWQLVLQPAAVRAP